MSRQSELENSISDMGKIQTSGELGNILGSVLGYYWIKRTES